MTTKEIAYFLSAGFSKEQIDEIIEGKKAGVATAVYANKKYLPIQMRQIRLGLMENLPVEQYASTDYDWLQMEELRMGLKSGVDINIYKNPEIHHEKMRQLRKGLEHGINLYSFLSLDAMVMRQLRKARINGVNILKYIDAGYDDKQLQEIRIALELGVNLDDYLKTTYSAASITQIRKGLERGVDVSLFAKDEYGWRQMREIRKGLENQIDVKKYISPLYSSTQMREMRLGMVAGLDVDSYGKLRYSAHEMRRRRMAMLDAIKKEQERILQAQVKSDDFVFDFMSNNMEAYVTVLTKDKVIGRERFLEILELNGIRKGIIEKAVDAVINKQAYQKSILIAQGQIPRKGEDGHYEFFFKTNPDRKPKIMEDGTADYRSIQWFEMVRTGQTLAIYHEAQDGRDGYDVLGNPVKARKGVEQRILTGKGFHIEADKKTYVADMDGMVNLTDNKIEISNHMQLPEVNMLNGNIYFEGSLHILGDVGFGAHIRATDDIVIDGTVESATIESGGSVVLKKGMNSAGNGMISAKKDVVSRFFESVQVITKGNIEVGKSLNSELSAEGLITSNGIIAGGVAKASSGFRVKHIGNQAGIKTILQLKVDDSLWEEDKTIKLAIMDAQSEMDMLKKSYEDFLQKYPAEVRNEMEVFKKLENTIFIKNRQLEQLIRMKNEVEATVRKTKEAKVIINGRAHEGVVVEMDGGRWQAGNEFNIVVMKKEDRVEILSK